MKTSHLTFCSARYPPYSKLWRTSYAPTPFPKRQVEKKKEVRSVFLAIISLRECAIFPPSSRICAQLPPPRRAALFYLIRDAAKHVTKNRMESPKFIILSSLPEIPTLLRLGIDSWRKVALEREEKRIRGKQAASLTDDGWLTSG